VYTVHLQFIQIKLNGLRRRVICGKRLIVHAWFPLLREFTIASATNLCGRNL
jgi:hypothetical protein